MVCTEPHFSSDLQPVWEMKLKNCFLISFSVCRTYYLGIQFWSNNTLEDACRKLSPEIEDSSKAKQKLRTEARSVKEALSNTNAASVMIESLFDGRDYSLSITRARFEMLTHSVIDR